MITTTYFLERIHMQQHRKGKTKRFQQAVWTEKTEVGQRRNKEARLHKR